MIKHFFRWVKRRTRDTLYEWIFLVLKKRKRTIGRSLIRLSRQRLFDTQETRYFADNIRLQTLELCAYEIQSKNVPGNIAELGVYRGDFAIKLNESFPDRKLFLFDTFSGFTENHSKFDIQQCYSEASQNFSNTSAEFVLGRMKYPENCIIKQGEFPASAQSVNEQFALVSIDVDLYQAIEAGLNFFFPRLSRGGYILVHDFNNHDWRGVRPAVVKFCEDNGLTYVPVADAYGSVVIAK